MDSVPLIIDALSSKGKGIAKFQNSKVEVPFSLPGDEIIVSLGKKRRGVYKAALSHIKAPSPMRVDPLCKHASVCGGCTLQHMSYLKQLEEKEGRIRALFAPLIKEALFHPILPALSPWHYRNKMEFSFSQNRAKERFLGLMQAKGRVCSLTECHIAPPWMIEALQAVYAFWENTDLLAYHPPSNTGSLRTLTLREGKRTGDKMAILTVSGNPEFALKRHHIDAFKETLERLHPFSLFLRIQQIAKKQPTQFYEMHLAGKPHIEEILEVNGRSWRCVISPSSFFQPNTLQAERLFARAFELVSPPKGVLDLYCGTAVLGLLATSYADKVTAVEINPYATFDAECNVLNNNVKDLDIVCSDVGAWLAHTPVHRDLVILDPPRSGLTPQALSHLLTLQPKEILYISCNPATQAENATVLIQAGYQLTHIQPVDLFPHTIHTENIIILKKPK